GYIARILPAGWSTELLQAIGSVTSFLVITVLLAAIFKILPDANLEWRDVWVGAVVTSALVGVGKAAIGVYLGKTAVASAYGAAGSFVVIVLWLYYASLILLFGAEFTKVWAEQRGRSIEPEPGAVTVVTQERSLQTH